MANIIFPNGNRTTMSYSRYLMCVKLGRKLKKTEHVDHIDEDKANDDDDNLQILTPAENNKKTRINRRLTKKIVILKCPNCKKIFERPRRQTHLVKKNYNYTSCSRSCSGKIASLIQNKKAIDLSDNIVKEKNVLIERKRRS